MGNKVNLSSLGKKKVAIIEDNKELRDGFDFIIKNSNKYNVIGLYDSYEEAILKISKNLPDVILMDIELPGKNGVEATALIKEKFSQVEIIVISVHDDNNLVLEAFKAGASGYLIKDFNYAELIQAIDDVLSGGSPMSGSVARLVVDQFHVNVNSPLSHREVQVLQMISRGMTYSQIAEELSISKETSKVHIRNIYKKLQVNSKSEAIALAQRERFI
ncbi:MAG: response regulator transcription factor [Cyclobacteriaceae bacterium]|nr:response regulator transcription factor [Cyclobacteriaceae bacterium]MCB0498561.1 response regulator transcription factor [Cyclobacteriaceae bacterium]MCB9236872.1 response regulator transcription factor [Flammeovirgaceae bacterium]MCO5271525.1 response regulator transcription factor [Cyclobacteriaceae bacterium]MCW5901421.1 response regulator transcription factor [Cyclobacteriaceae bacterium]